MAYVRKRAGAWYAEVVRRGVRDSKTLPTKAAAQAWAKAREQEILTGAPTLSKGTFGAALDRYERDVSPTKRGHRWEALRLKAWQSLPIARIPLLELRPADVAKWRDDRLKVVSPSTVAREFNLIRSVLEIARREWGWVQVNVAKDVKRPPSPPPRNRRVSEDEAERLCMALGYTGGTPETISQRIAVAFLFAIETGMRTGEICGLTWARVREKNVALPRTKNGDAREVSLSKEARRLIGLMPREGASVFHLTERQVDALFRKAKKRAGVVDLHFHDSRAEFCTRAARRIDILDLARTIGHRNLRSLQIYYRATADEIADRLG
jgi:integrase